MIGFGYPTEYLPPAGTEDVGLVHPLIGLLLMVAFATFVLWHDIRAKRRTRPEVRIERPADFRKAA